MGHAAAAVAAPRLNRRFAHGPGITITAVGFLGVRRGFLSQLLLLCIGCIVVLQTTRQLLFFDLRRKVLDNNPTAISDVAKHDDDAAAAAATGTTPITTATESLFEVQQNTRVVKAVPIDLSLNKASKSKSPIRETATERSPSKKRVPTVVAMNGLEPMREIMQRSWKGNSLLCESINKARQNASDHLLPVTVNITFGCQELFDKAGCGTGNFLFVLYGMRLTAKVFPNVGLNLTCTDAGATKHDLILPWLMGWFPPRSPEEDNPYSMVKPKETCGLYWKVPISRMYKEMRFDFRRMAVELVGIPERNHPSANFVKASRALASSGSSSWAALLQQPKTQTSGETKPRLEMDDAVVHFRCGDLMNTDHPAYGFMTFLGYTRHISPEARSIGILTSPFDAGAQVRELDSGPTIRDRCIIVVSSLVDYVQQKFPNARVRVHNDANETIAVTYSRMVMANQTIVGISSFGVFPAIATFGTGYIRRPDYDIAPNKWVLYPPIDKLADNVVLFDEPVRIMAPAMKALWNVRGKDGVLEWFWNDTATTGI